jgi:hypothetical protein
MWYVCTTAHLCFHVQGERDMAVQAKARAEAEITKVAAERDHAQARADQADREARVEVRRLTATLHEAHREREAQAKVRICKFEPQHVLH